MTVLLQAILERRLNGRWGGCGLKILLSLQAGKFNVPLLWDFL